MHSNILKHHFLEFNCKYYFPCKLKFYATFLQASFSSSLLFLCKNARSFFQVKSYTGHSWQNFTSTQCLSSKKSLLPIQSPNKFLKQNEARILSCQSHQAVQAWLAQDLSILNWQHCHSHHAQCFFLLTHCTYVTVSSLNHDWHALFCLSDPGMHTQFWHTFWMVHQVIPDLKNQKERYGPWNCWFFPKIDQQPI